jgi:hypothetical protein
MMLVMITLDCMVTPKFLTLELPFPCTNTQAHGTRPAERVAFLVSLLARRAGRYDFVLFFFPAPWALCR